MVQKKISLGGIIRSASTAGGSEGVPSVSDPGTLLESHDPVTVDQQQSWKDVRSITQSEAKAESYDNSSQLKKLLNVPPSFQISQPSEKVDNLIAGSYGGSASIAWTNKVNAERNSLVDGSLVEPSQLQALTTNAKQDASPTLWSIRDCLDILPRQSVKITRLFEAKSLIFKRKRKGGDDSVRLELNLFDLLIDVSDDEKCWWWQPRGEGQAGFQVWTGPPDGNTRLTVVVVADSDSEEAFSLRYGAHDKVGSIGVHYVRSKKHSIFLKDWAVAERDDELMKKR